MGHGRRMADQRLHASEALRQGNQLQLPEELPIIILLAEDKRDHGAGPVRLSCLDFIARVTFESGEIHPVRVAASVEPSGYFFRIFHMPVHPDAQGLDAPDHEEAVPGPEHPADRVLQIIETVRQLFVLHRGQSGDRIAVASQVLRSAVDHNVRPEGERPLKIRCQKRIVHDEKPAGPVGNPGNRLDIRHREKRV